MSTALSISDVGLRLIKAYEGFRPVDVELISGQRVAGYGHRVMGGQSIHLSEEKAEQLLKQDLAPFEAMINDNVFAPLTQSQFDALCSLAYNIGPKKFLESDVVRALNNGRVLDAANGFDVWRMGRINGESYVVDALVRRRTAEKVLFLRPTLATAKAPRVDLAAGSDPKMEGASTAAAAPILEDSGLVSVVNYALPSDVTDEADSRGGKKKIKAEESAGGTLAKDRRKKKADPNRPTPMRRRDDRPGGVLTLSEVFEDEQGKPDPIVQELGDFMSDLKTSVAPDDLFDDTPDEVTPLKPAADDSVLELNDIVEYDDSILADEIVEDRSNILELKDALPEDTAIDDEAFDPSQYIVGDSTESRRANDVDDDVLKLTAADETQSPIAAAAAQVSGRLDALMADDEQVKAEEEKNVLPFRAVKSKNIADDKGTKLRQDNPLYGSLIGATDTNDAEAEKPVSQKPESQPPVSQPPVKQKPAGVNTLDDTAQKDSAARYIASNIAPAQHKQSKTGLNLLVIAGMTMLGASVGAILSGWDQRYGPGGEFLSTTGALLGLMITLGSVSYILKKPDQTQ